MEEQPQNYRDIVYLSVPSRRRKKVPLYMYNLLSLAFGDGQAYEILDLTVVLRVSLQPRG